MIDEITKKFEDYFNHSKKDYWIGIQNFQGVREYTKIPLAPLTLVYGQNSAGKSTIHDAQKFIHSFLGGIWDGKTTREYLSRWANHDRNSSLLKGYLGNPDDIVLSISAYASETDYFDWENDHYENWQSAREEPIYQFFASLLNGGVNFKLDLFFSCHINVKKQNVWNIRKLSISFGDDVFIEIVPDKEPSDEGYIDYYQIKLNKQHVVYCFFDQFFERGIANLIEDNYEAVITDDWINILKVEVAEGFEWKRPIINWFNHDIDNREKLSHDNLRFRDLLAGLITVPSLAASNRMDFYSVPPIRPIPSKQETVFRRFSEMNDKLSDWSILARQVCSKFIHEHYPSSSEEEQSRDKRFFSQLDEINRILSHPLFLNTDYEVTGECLFLAPIEVFKETNKSTKAMRELLMQLGAEIHLKLRHKVSGHLIEIEDVGVGISQIIPVLAAISRGDYYFIKSRAFIQQPELHLHPKLQAQLADAFIECINKSDEFTDFTCFIVESHSEHFLLRLLRRIRETHKSDIKNKLFGLSSKDVSVLYVDKTDDGSSKIFPLRISPEGEFIDRWPHGFFTERDGELFDE